jgi:hypothetical protein
MEGLGRRIRGFSLRGIANLVEGVLIPFIGLRKEVRGNYLQTYPD